MPSLKKLQSGQSELDANRTKLDSADAEIAANEAELNSGEAEIAANEKKLTDGEKEIRENEEKLKDSEQKLKDARKELEDGKKDYEDGQKEAQDEIKDGQQKIDDAKNELNDLEKPEWIITDRNGLPEYSDYGDNADRIKNIGEVFPCDLFPGRCADQSYDHDANGRRTENTDRNDEGTGLQQDSYCLEVFKLCISGDGRRQYCRYPDR